MGLLVWNGAGVELAGMNELDFFCTIPLGYVDSVGSHDRNVLLRFGRWTGQWLLV